MSLHVLNIRTFSRPVNRRRLVLLTLVAREPDCGSLDPVITTTASWFVWERPACPFWGKWQDICPPPHKIGANSESSLTLVESAEVTEGFQMKIKCFSRGAAEKKYQHECQNVTELNATLTSETESGWGRERGREVYAWIDEALRQHPAVLQWGLLKVSQAIMHFLLGNSLYKKSLLSKKTLPGAFGQHRAMSCRA